MKLTEENINKLTEAMMTGVLDTASVTIEGLGKMNMKKTAKAITFTLVVDRPDAPKVGNRWTAEEDATLVEMYANNKECSAIVDALHRTEGAICARLIKTHGVDTAAVEEWSGVTMGLYFGK